MAKKAAATLVRFLESNGFEYERTNSKNVEFYTHPRLGEIFVNPAMNEKAAKDTERKTRRRLGLDTDKDASKRHADTIKERERGNRERAAVELSKLDERRAVILAEKDRLATEFGTTSMADVRRISEEIERIEKERRYWVGLMTETPDSGHRGTERVKHRA